MHTIVHQVCIHILLLLLVRARVIIIIYELVYESIVIL